MGVCSRYLNFGEFKPPPPFVKEIDVMANICSCCGKKLPFLDVGFDLIEIEGEDYYVCSACNNNFTDYKRGNLSLEELV